MSERGDRPFDDRISLYGLRFEGRHGALDGEQDAPQPFEVDVVLHARLEIAADADDLEATVDYRVLVELVRSVIEGPSVRIIEALAGDIARDVLDATDADVVDAVEVSVRKPEAPIDATLEGVEVTLLRRRANLGPGGGAAEAADPGRMVSRRAARRG